MPIQRLQRTVLVGLLVMGMCVSCVSGLRKAAPVDTAHPWLKGKKIFLDPGHGGTAADDPLRTAAEGITEEALNLRVGLLLRDMLAQAGAAVVMSRTRDVDVPLPARVDAAKECEPDLLVSIHHNAAIAPGNVANYPCVFIWGSDSVNPAGFDFAKLLLAGLENWMDAKGQVISDFSVYAETGTLLLRKTCDLCPAVIGEAGFITDPRHARRLSDQAYLRDEAQAYFQAISAYFQKGRPTADAHFNCPIDPRGPSHNTIHDPRPEITLVFASGSAQAHMDWSTLRMSLDGIPVTYKRLSDAQVRVCYGEKIYPGIHRLRFQCRSSNQLGSMVYCLSFTLAPKPGEREALMHEGYKLIQQPTSRMEGLKMLSAAYSVDPTGPDADSLLYALSEGFRLSGHTEQAGYLLERLYYFYPQSPLRAEIEKDIRTGYRFPADFYGKEVRIIP